MTKLTTLFIASSLALSACAGSDDEPLAPDQQPIVGGSPEKIQDLPWQISLQFLGSHVCGGSIVDETHVVTARHCMRIGFDETEPLGFVSPHNYKVAAGISKLSQTDHGQLVEVDDIVPLEHAWDGHAEHGGDIVLLRLAHPLHFNRKVQPIELATPDDVRDGTVGPGRMARVSGWGLTKFVEKDQVPSDQLLSVDVPIVPIETAELLNGSPLSRELVAAGGVPGKDSCSGDSGGPLVVERGHHTLLAGVVSFGIRGCGEPGLPGLYTGVASYADRIYAALCEDRRVVAHKEHLAGHPGETQFIKVNVPAGLREVNFHLIGENGDVDMRVKKGARPTEDDFDCKSALIGRSQEFCNFGAPTPGTYWIMLLGFEDYTDAKLRVVGYQEE